MFEILCIIYLVTTRSRHGLLNICTFSSTSWERSFSKVSNWSRKLRKCLAARSRCSRRWRRGAFASRPRRRDCGAWTWPRCPSIDRLRDRRPMDIQRVVSPIHRDVSMYDYLDGAERVSRLCLAADGVDDAHEFLASPGFGLETLQQRPPFRHEMKVSNLINQVPLNKEWENSDLISAFDNVTEGDFYEDSSNTEQEEIHLNLRLFLSISGWETVFCAHFVDKTRKSSLKEMHFSISPFYVSHQTVPRGISNELFPKIINSPSNM